jgi:hypothetical protein
MSREESLAAVIRDALQASLERQGEDPDAIDRVGSAVGVALGGAAGLASDADEPLGHAPTEGDSTGIADRA